ncbi:hypothetical protein DIU31_003415 [Mucilaginibacter rubeus]|uniref:Uncharacterized protein n=1 Tax=Mucilaginibacter rubeus TaxID=2027860 RepID=A0AAE6JBZ6_9SPHI|nr:MULTISPECIES: hypothetical protein [Mucilaginibacter]QEM02611.1 hypothetical protein DIU31_003415 [Mucilaginibacter rubeus]QEM15232.1 hypothetical protein DIU38_003455 [Mucilaginibacter gossypii]QTE42044.1 hypothetical protein J3L19_24355 [Mucilaginibacter rubeus]QTE48645.1 hypothetical protein J3L21_24330 [Mucilaginibacter rubeus]QTE60031.1 hypothetical protein J3L23_15960 [Mucilaginibacter rubeus]
MKKTLIIIVAILLISNLPIFNFFVQENYQYQNFDSSFTYSEESGKGKSFIGCIRTYGHFLCEHPEKDKGDNWLYRTFAIKPWRFWEWSQMLFSERYRLPYKEKTNK